MKNLKKYFLLFLLTMFFSVNTHAGNAKEKYIGAQLVLGTVSADGVSGDMNPTAIIGRFGMHLDKTFSVEGRLGIGLTDDDIDVFGTTVTGEIDTVFGAYGRASAPLSDSTSVYGIVGLTRGEATLSAPGLGEASDSTTDLSFGVGLDVKLSGNMVLNFEYISYVTDDVDVEGLAVGFVVPMKGM